MSPASDRILEGETANKGNDKFTLNVLDYGIEDAPHGVRRGRGRPKKTVGRKRRGTSMGRYPFIAAVNKYLESRTGVIMESTYQEESRKLRYLARVLEGLCDSGKIASLEPKKILREDIQVFLTWMEKKQLDPTTRQKYLHLLNNLLMFYENPIIQNMKRQTAKLHKMPRKSIRWLKDEDLSTIQRTAQGMKGWMGEVSKFLVNFYPATGIRPSEMRLAWIEDLDIEKWTFFVRIPKGLGSYGEQRRVMVLPQAREATLRFLLAREKYLKEKGLVGVKALVPNCRGETYSMNSFEKMKRKVEKSAGVKFRLKDFRSTFATQTARIDPNLIPDISTALGHTSIETTQRFYAQMDRESAGRRIEEAWKRKLASTPKTPLIETEKYLSGYA
jgi:integrase